ncbi:hypothetical protein H0H81_008221 [Sphagnurus paluster]|uniref:MYND-type domain-containing protein n=1 Tax=Sphagnurus paluster TaxID=117069 RepID=A0A9P7GN51_9AGAR|nr:hypothetical protein H0H81_008221 [Sphagnurus paluster]
MAVINYAQCRAILARIKRLGKPRTNNKQEHYTGALDRLRPLGLGSGAEGAVLSCAPCANQILHGCPSLKSKSCSDTGVLACSNCFLVKYCSRHCQKQHRQKHRVDCKSSNDAWQPVWNPEERNPQYNEGFGHGIPKVHPAADCLQLCQNETEHEAVNMDFNLCLASCGDIRNLVQTVNGLPKGYRGKCDILLNDTDAIVLNRSLVILCALLSAGPSIEESAELAVHLMYSAALTPASAAYLRGCTRIVYGDGASDGDMSFQCTLETRGPGKICSMQSTMSMRRPIEMFLSCYELRNALEGMRRTMVSENLDCHHLDRYFANLKPSHRVSVVHFRESGILAPFSLDVRGFSQPNRLVVMILPSDVDELSFRLMYTCNGDWLGHAGTNPLFGWTLSEVIASGAKHGVDAADIMGCLFFHVKRELMEFAHRMKEFHVNIQLTQFNLQVLSKAISIGALPGFKYACFDRVELPDITDRGDNISETLMNWAPLLNRGNRNSCILMHSKKWHRSQPKAALQSNPRTIDIFKLMERFKNVPALESCLKIIRMEGNKSPTVTRLIDSLDAFADHEGPFREYLRVERAEFSAQAHGLRIRKNNRIHPKVRLLYATSPDPDMIFSDLL